MRASLPRALCSCHTKMALHDPSQSISRSSVALIASSSPCPVYSPAKKSLLDPSRASYRFIILAFNCLLTLGSYYAFDMPSVLQNELVSQVITPFSPNGAQTLYNSWYTAYAWCNMCMSLFAGVLVDRWGTSKCSILFLCLIIVGQSIFTLGAFLARDHATTPLPYAVMFAGRLVFGLGGGPITIVQNTIAARWFTGKELAFAFGVSLTVSRFCPFLLSNPSPLPPSPPLPHPSSHSLSSSSAVSAASSTTTSPPSYSPRRSPCPPASVWRTPLCSALFCAAAL